MLFPAKLTFALTSIALAGSVAFATNRPTDVTVRPDGTVDTSKLPRTVCLAQQWVAEHRAVLPTTLREFSEYPIPYRKAIYAEQPKNIQQSLWAEHFASFLTEDSSLSPQQQAVVRQVFNNLGQYMADGEAGEQLRAELKAETINLWGDERSAREVFATLGPVFDLASDGTFQCQCEEDEGGGDCEDGFDCGSVTQGCEQNESCDWIWDDTCDGMCLQN